MFSGHQHFMFCLLVLLLTEVFHRMLTAALPSLHNMRDVQKLRPWDTVVQRIGPAWSGRVLERDAHLLRPIPFPSAVVSQLFQLLSVELHKAVKWAVVYYEWEHGYSIIKDLLLNHSLTNGFEPLGLWTELISERERFTVPLLIGYKIWTPRTKSLIDVMDNL